MCQGRAPRLRATLNQAGSMRRKPCAVENKIGHTAATPIRKMMAPSQVLNAMIAIGHPGQRRDHAQELKGHGAGLARRPKAANQNAAGHAECCRPGEARGNAAKARQRHPDRLTADHHAPQPFEGRHRGEAREVQLSPDWKRRSSRPATRLQAGPQHRRGPNRNCAPHAAATRTLPEQARLPKCLRPRSPDSQRQHLGAIEGIGRIDARILLPFRIFVHRVADIIVIDQILSDEVRDRVF